MIAREFHAEMNSSIPQIALIATDRTLRKSNSRNDMISLGFVAEYYLPQNELKQKGGLLEGGTDGDISCFLTLKHRGLAMAVYAS